MIKYFFTILFSVFILTNVNSQRDVKSEIIGTPWIGIQYGLNNSTNDLKERFGLLNHLGILAGYKTKQNWFFGIESNFIFGSQVNANYILDNLRDSYGDITDANGNIAITPLFARGFNINASFGKVIPILSPNPNSGIFIHTGIGYLLHKIRIESNNQVIPEIELDYKKGYDRLTSGFCSQQFIGYSYMSNGGFFNWYAGFYALQGFTKNQRTIFYDQPDIPVSNTIRKDFSYGFKIGWLIPIYKRKTKDFYYN